MSNFFRRKNDDSEVFKIEHGEKIAVLKLLAMVNMKNFLLPFTPTSQFFAFRLTFFAATWFYGSKSSLIATSHLHKSDNFFS